MKTALDDLLQKLPSVENTEALSDFVDRIRQQEGGYVIAGSREEGDNIVQRFLAGVP